MPLKPLRPFTLLVPKQDNTYNYGIFVCLYALVMLTIITSESGISGVISNSHHPPFTHLFLHPSAFGFVQNDIPIIRYQFRYLLWKLFHLYQENGNKHMSTSSREVDVYSTVFNQDQKKTVVNSTKINAQQKHGNNPVTSPEILNPSISSLPSVRHNIDSDPLIPNKQTIVNGNCTTVTLPSSASVNSNRKNCVSSK